MCEWIEARKIDASSPLEVLWKGKWEPRSKFNIIKEKFVKSAIGLVPTHGYGCKDRHSKESIEWLSLLQKQWLDKGKPIAIQHARTEAGEKIIAYQGLNKVVKYKVDGYFEYQGKRYVCEYHGCNFHWCMKCFPHNRETTMNNHRSIAQRWRDTQLKEKRLKEKGYVVLSKWSCEFAEEKQKPKVRDFLNTVNIPDPINLKDCYFGGRTNALVLHKKFADVEKGKYVDFTSLYPDILKYRRFPVGHPKRIIKDFQQCLFKPCDGNCFYFPCEGKHWVLPYFGVIKVTVLPPTDLIHPVLPLKCN